MIIIGIDPDNNKSGYGIVDTETKTVVDSGKKPFVELLRLIEEQSVILGDKLRVVVEAGWLNKGNWHVSWQTTAPMAASIGRAVGMNHQTGILLCQLLEDDCIAVTKAKPLRKVWKGKDGKITASELKMFTNYDKRTNQDERDAILLAWEYGRLPIRIFKTNKK